MRKKIEEDALFIAVVAFILPMVILLLTIDWAPMGFMGVIDAQTADIVELRSRFMAGRIYVSDAISDILTGHLYPSFLICLIFGGSIGRFLLGIFFYVRFGLLSLGMYKFLAGHVKIRSWTAMVLSCMYALSSVNIVSSVNPQIFNIMIVAPFALCVTETLMRRGLKADFWCTVAVYALFACGGFTGVLTGLLFAVCIVPILRGLIPGAKTAPVVKSYLLSLFAQAIAIVPVFITAPDFVDVKAAFSESRITFKIFDFLLSTLEGTPFTVSAAGTYSVMGSSVLIILLVLLFFTNRVIPYKAKIACGLVILLVIISCSWSLLSSILSVFGYEEAMALARIGMLNVLLFTMAAISLRNIDNASRNEIAFVVFAVLSLIVISNASSAGEVTRSVFFMWFNAGVCFFWGIFLFINMRNKVITTEIMTLVGILLIGINLAYCFSISGKWGDVTSLKPYSKKGQTEITVIAGDSIPLYGSRDEYICVDTDLRQVASDSDITGVMNVLSNASVLDNLFVDAGSFPVFTEGVSDQGNGTYYAEGGAPYEILIRCESMNNLSNYFLISNFKGENTITETYNDIDVVNTLTGPYVKLLRLPVSSMTVRQTGISSNGTSSFSIWKEDAEVYEAFMSKINGMTDYEGFLTDSIPSSYTGVVTIVTSVPFSVDRDINVSDANGRLSAETFNYGGRLAVAFENTGSPIVFRINSISVIPMLAIVVWLFAVILIVYKLVKNKDDIKV